MVTLCYGALEIVGLLLLLLLLLFRGGSANPNRNLNWLMQVLFH